MFALAAIQGFNYRQVERLSIEIGERAVFLSDSGRWCPK
jgi:hypothetical protein